MLFNFTPLVDNSYFQQKEMEQKDLKCLIEV